MLIGIDGSRAFVKQRTGIEEYSYQVIKNLMEKLGNHRIFLYLKKNQKIDFDLPDNWKTKTINSPRFWTQIGLSLEMLFHPADVLFVPAHIIPIIHPKNTIVAIHGLEYEILPKAYSFWEKLYMRWSIKLSCQWAKKIIAVSENTKKDLMKLYKIPENKIEVVYEGVSNFLLWKRGTKGDSKDDINFSNPSLALPFLKGENRKYLLFIGRLEERKNIIGIIRAFEILKEHYKIPHRLVLAGKFGYGEKKIRQEIKNANCSKDIILTGFVSETEKWELLKNADVFLFPTFYEGFGLPILEAQSVGAPVVAGNNSSIPEITNNSARLVNSNNAEKIADATYELISDKKLRDGIIEKGRENAKRFNWDKCADSVAKILNG